MYAGGVGVVVVEGNYWPGVPRGITTGYVTNGQALVVYVGEPIRSALYESRLPAVDFAAIREELERFRLQRWFDEREAWPDLEPHPPPAGAILGRLAPPRMLARSRGRRPARSRPGMRRARDLARLAP